MRPTDLVSTLVSIYDSHDLFIKELQSLFSHILLRSRDGNFDAEVSPKRTPITRVYTLQKRQIEILKLRFGDAALQGPDVMLADMQTSSRVNRLIHDGQPEVNVVPLVFSVFDAIY